VDAIPFHAYPETWTPPDVDLERYLGPQFNTGFIRSADETCGRRPIWINETGFATTEGVSEQAQAEWWVRAIASFAAQPRVEEIGVYEIKDLRPDREAIGGTPNYHLGLLHADRSRKPAFATVKMLASMFSQPFSIEPPVVHRLVPDDGGDLFAYGFRLVDGRQLLVLWAKRAAMRVDVTIAQHATKARERMLDGGASQARTIERDTLADVALVPGSVRLFELQ
jgi:hypothetical protein